MTDLLLLFSSELQMARVRWLSSSTVLMEKTNALRTWKENSSLLRICGQFKWKFFCLNMQSYCHWHMIYLNLPTSMILNCRLALSLT